MRRVGIKALWGQDDGPREGLQLGTQACFRRLGSYLPPEHSVRSRGLCTRAKGSIDTQSGCWKSKHDTSLCVGGGVTH